MTINKKTHTGYEGRFGEVTSNSPTGSYKNKTDSSTNDGSFLEQDWANDAYDGLNGAFLANVHDASTGEPQGYTDPFNQNGTVTLNGNVDTAQASQVYNAWYKKTQDVADGRIAAKQLEEKIAELETLAEGCWFQYYSTSADNATHLTPTTPSNLNFKAQASGNIDPIYNMNNFELNTAGDTLTFKKAGVYTITMGFVLGENMDSASGATSFIGKMNLKKPSDSAFSNFFTSDLLLYEFASFYQASNGSYQPNRMVSFFVRTDSSGITSAIRMPTITHPLIINIEEDNTEFQFNFSGKNAGNVGFIYNLFMSFTRLGKPVDPNDFQMPEDLLA